MKNKKIISIILSTSIAPIAFAISCGQKIENKRNDKGNSIADVNKSFEADVEMEAVDNQHDENWGKSSFFNPEATFTENLNLEEYKERKLSGQPFNLHFHPRDLLNWSKEKDADWSFNKGSIPLRNREWAYKILDSQMNNNIDILAGLQKATSKNRVGTTSQDEDYQRIFNQYSNVNALVAWGGSTSEGAFVLPSGDQINAAHKNGVPVLATVFTATPTDGGSESNYIEMLKDSNESHFPIADKMVEMTNYYGFDGYFLNFESLTQTNSVREKMNKFAEYLYGKLKENNKKLYVYSEGIGGNLLKSKNFDIAALDYGYKSNLTNLNIEEGKYSYGYDLSIGQFSSQDHGNPLNWNDKTRPAYIGDKNTWIYTYFKNHDVAKSGEDFDLKFWSNSSDKRDLRIEDGDSWHEAGKYYNQRTVINNRNNFETIFQLGYGNKWFVNGREMELNENLSHGFKNPGIQSVLPTWRYINDIYSNDDVDFKNPENRLDSKVIPIEYKNSTWKSEINEGETFHGSTRLHYSGKIPSGKSIVNQLFAANTKLMENDKFTILQKGKELIPELAIWNEKEIKTIKASPRIIDRGTGYFEVNYYVPKILDNFSCTSFGLKFKNSKSNDLNVDHIVSSLKFQTKVMENKNRITNINSDGVFSFNNSNNLRLNWKMENDNEVDHYVVYKSNDDEIYSEDKVMQITSTPSAYLTNIDGGKIQHLTIAAYSAGGEIISENIIKVNTPSFNDVQPKWPSSVDISLETNPTIPLTPIDESSSSAFIARFHGKPEFLGSGGQIYSASIAISDLGTTIPFDSLENEYIKNMFLPSTNPDGVPLTTTILWDGEISKNINDYQPEPPHGPGGPTFKSKWAKVTFDDLHGHVKTVFVVITFR